MHFIAVLLETWTCWVSLLELVYWGFQSACWGLRTLLLMSQLWNQSTWWRIIPLSWGYLTLSRQAEDLVNEPKRASYRVAKQPLGAGGKGSISRRESQPFCSEYARWPLPASALESAGFSQQRYPQVCLYANLFPSHPFLVQALHFSMQ